MHYGPPPPLAITDLEPMRKRGELRFANRLSTWIEVEDGNITGSGYSGAGNRPGFSFLRPSVHWPFYPHPPVYDLDDR